MLYVVDGDIYLFSNGTYQKHSLRVNAGGYYLEKEAGSLKLLPGNCEVLSFDEVVAQFGSTATAPAPPPKRTASKRSDD